MSKCSNLRLVADYRQVTYSPAYTLVPTYECFNRCTYCNFRHDPGNSPWLKLADAQNQLRKLKSQGVCEILVLSGEVHPYSPRRQSWFQRIYAICELALSWGFLPHTNVGPLSFSEMQKLRQVNVSMGLMLEQLTPRLLQTVHRHAPSKIPQVRLQQLEWAGQLQIPFTTGVLLGIGERQEELWETLEAIAQLHSCYGQIQEVILQPHSPGTQQTKDTPAFALQQLPEVIAKARQILPAEIVVQIPPNLVPDANWLIACLEAGARDLGGIGPTDEVNPDYPHPHAHRLRAILELAGWQLLPRLPIYPQYDGWLPKKLQAVVKQWRATKLSHI
ncbi:MAG: 7,8-didemethyl-8-hydroxy-5-deazariboflavin synthase subunit CofG [Symploca sp. SIO3C6]|uniref:7,8-didemethyl-8-hydroxy-5-deazariboflavin synthase n=1 Tax=Symploca sp. SIO1C4 TaxID=2607765 RepID=A0A6B3NGV6_9CYAN|nr:7,8-didemethyl-8-hydroxy-5-deazariboflavin synthase subunit CofG [Symploca sp. SIO3C6]NER29782.1 7,8-didemethyl-8-hydroxy-5-deazariboflavin synthase subunit CofG [Symploca sp. SIO1C4]NET04622.1 7,8-didemethyl-8-hydroxy-5-deazariboflavin synthase subunit CofG [Symploca sp. SIO2B6]